MTEWEAESLLMLLSTIMQQLKKRCHLYKSIHSSSWKCVVSHPFVFIYTYNHAKISGDETRKTESKDTINELCCIEVKVLAPLTSEHLWGRKLTTTFNTFIPNSLHRWIPRMGKIHGGTNIHLQPKLQIFKRFYSCRTSLCIPKDAVNLTVLLKLIFSDIYIYGLGSTFSCVFITNDQEFEHIIEFWEIYKLWRTIKLIG